MVGGRDGREYVKQSGPGRHGGRSALVGDPETVVARIQEYADLGIDTFIFSGYPHLEEAYRVAELLFPKLGVEAPDEVARLSDLRGDRRYGQSAISPQPIPAPAS